MKGIYQKFHSSDLNDDDVSLLTTFFIIYGTDFKRIQASIFLFCSI